MVSRFLDHFVRRNVKKGLHFAGKRANCANPRIRKLERVTMEAPKTYTIKVNRDEFHDEPRFITGADILILVGQNDGNHGVAILRGGGEHDIPVGLTQKVDLEDDKNRRFKTFADKSTEGE